ncbi:alpha/beta fold hydrolase [Flavihumibacter rivuli]|uniref:alpha/beta hydrolase family protein n=1 Tax=Flavihumibacter rivuli TaxID=2838156 RepID=UPI001BDE2853|nr:alpha/beta hydrolase [Flavihumibacter rivuli]ULQ56287.1 alpha/beta fold hydrolase [Flavihumibacter rivuli]
MTKKILTLLLLALPVLYTTAQTTGSSAIPPRGNWTGAIQLNASRSLRIGIEFPSKPNQRPWFHSMDQQMYNIPIRLVEQKRDSVQLTISHPNAVVTIAFNGKEGKGNFRQGNFVAPVALQYTDSPFSKPLRPQEPVYPLPYKEEDITYRNSADSVTLAATLTLPRSGKPSPAILLIPGSGPNDRDAYIFGHKVFLVLADYFTRKGFVVLRADDRGTGASTGKYSTASIKDLANDAKAGVEYLRSRKEVNPERVFIMGHSLGAEIASLTALNNRNVNGVVLLAGAGESLRETILRQTADIYAQQGVSREGIDLNTKVLLAVFDAVQKYPTNDSTLAAIERSFASLNPLVEQVPAKERDILELSYPLNPKAFGHFWGKAMRFDLFYQPLDSYRQLQQPVLVTQGTSDVQVKADNAERIGAVLNNKASVVKLFDSKNHLFQTCKSCTVEEYGSLTETFSPEVLDFIYQWLRKNL